jgi:hypothetical protein
MVGMTNHKGQGTWFIRTYYIGSVLDSVLLMTELFWIASYLSVSLPGFFLTWCAKALLVCGLPFYGFKVITNLEMIRTGALRMADFDQAKKIAQSTQ